MWKFAFVLILLLATNPATEETALGNQQKPGCTDCESLRGNRKVKYRIAKRALSKDQKAVSADISINGKAFTQAELVRLACQLNQDFGAYENVVVAVFDNYKAAQKYTAPWEQEKPAGWQEHEKSLRAYYVRNQSKGEHWVAWYSDPTVKKNRKESRLCFNK